MPGYRPDRRLWCPAVIASAVLAAVAGCTSATSPSSSSSSSSAVPSSPAGGAEQVSGGPSGSYIVPTGIGKIKHVIIAMQENGEPGLGLDRHLPGLGRLGGFYDHVVPTAVDQNGYSLRVPS